MATMSAAMKQPKRSRRHAGSPRLNINTANIAQLATLPGIDSTTAFRIVAARSGRHGLFKDWADLQARVRGLRKKTVAKVEASGLAVLHVPWCFDPVVDLPSDLAAICLSFVGVRSLLAVAQRVSHAWKDALDGGLPAIWHEVFLGYTRLTDDQLAEVARKSHGRIQMLEYHSGLSMQSLIFLHSCPSMRVLDVDLHKSSGCSISSLLPCLPLLQELSVRGSSDVVFPHMQHLHTAWCSECDLVTGLHNLPSLTKLGIWHCSLDGAEEWPTSIRQVSIEYCNNTDHRIVERIASMQHLVELTTDWSFASDVRNSFAFFTPPYDQLSCLSSIASLHSLSVNLHQRDFIHDALFNLLDTLTSLRDLRLFWVMTADHEMQRLTQLTSVQHLSVSHAEITVEGARYLSALPNLTKLVLDKCWLVDYSVLGTCSQLRDLRIVSVWNQLSLAEVQAICQLQHMEKLHLAFKRLVDPSSFSLFCTMRSLRQLQVPYQHNHADPPPAPVPAMAYASLPCLSLLEIIRLPDVEAHAELVECLVQMPKLRIIYVPRMRLSGDDVARLRDALPRLESIGHLYDP